jgi:hypothetical protein
MIEDLLTGIAIEFDFQNEVRIVAIGAEKTVRRVGRRPSPYSSSSSSLALAMISCWTLGGITS